MRAARLWAAGGRRPRKIFIKGYLFVHSSCTRGPGGCGRNVVRAPCAVQGTPHPPQVRGGQVFLVLPAGWRKPRTGFQKQTSLRVVVMQDGASSALFEGTSGRRVAATLMPKCKLYWRLENILNSGFPVVSKGCPRREHVVGTFSANNIDHKPF